MEEEIPKFPELYKFTNKKVHVWGINVKKVKNDLYRLHYYYGEKDGALTEKTYDITEGKQKRTIQDHFKSNQEFLKNFNKNSNFRTDLEKFYFMLNKSKISWVNQPNPKGFGDAVKHAKSFVGNEVKSEGEFMAKIIKKI